MSKAKGSGRGDIPGQLQIDWSVPTVSSAEGPAGSIPAAADALPLMQHLKWDFVTSFPRPTPEAIDAGIISDEDATPEGVRAIHDEHARELLMTLHDLDAVLDARRRSVDPATGKPASTNAARERLQKRFIIEPERLERWFQNLMASYEQAFGSEAADAFDKAIRARHAGIPVMTESTQFAVPLSPAPVERAPMQQLTANPVRPSRPRRALARLPVPEPLPSAVAAGHFGQEENGQPVRPSAREVREITEQHAEKLIDMLDSIRCAPANGKENIVAQFTAGISAYAEDFGQEAADQLEAYTRHQAGLEPGVRRGR